MIAFGAAGVAAYHAHEADVARTGSGRGVDEVSSTTVFRAAPQQVARAAKTANNPVGGAAPPADRNASESEPKVAKHRLREESARRPARARRRSLAEVRPSDGPRGRRRDRLLADSNPRSTEATHEAKLDLEVPADRLESTLDRIGTAGTVQNRSIEAEDVDATIVDEEARLRNLRREEIDLRTLMDKGGKVSDILEVQQNLSEVRGQIEQLDAQHKNDLHRVATSTISVQITEDRPNASPVKSGPGARSTAPGTAA